MNTDFSRRPEGTRFRATRASIGALACALLLLATSAGAQPTRPATVPAGPPEGAAFDAYEWVILVCDPNQAMASASPMFQSTLPDFVQGRRPAAPPEQENDPSPVGVLRIAGNAGGDRLDVLLENKGGRFLATYPKGQSRSAGYLWQNLQPASEKPSQDSVTAGHWFNQLRRPDAPPYLVKDGHGERFVLYDPEVSYKLPLKVEAGDAPGSYKLTNASGAALHDLVAYKKSADGWHAGTLAELSPATRPATNPATRPATAPRAAAPASPPASAPTAPVAPVAQPTVDGRSTQVTEAPAALPATTVAATAPASRPATTRAASGPSATPGMPIVLSATGAADPAILAPWRATLSDAGLPDTDFDLILAILAKSGLDARRLTVVYRLDPSEMDRLLPLEITPQPRRIVRVGLVIVRDVDPAIAREIDDLVAQLGDASWEKREAAMKLLRELGLAAKPKLEAALKSKDLEVVYRAERLIAALTKGANGTPNQPAAQ